MGFGESSLFAYLMVIAICEIMTIRPDQSLKFFNDALVLDCEQWNCQCAVRLRGVKRQ